MKLRNYLFMGLFFVNTAYSNSGQDCPALLQHTAQKLGSSEQINLCESYAGKVLLVVNTASKCAFTSQYAGLEKLYDDNKDKGFVVLGFPSNDFANQEPEGDSKIQEFCRLNYGVSFPMFSKIRVKGESAHPFYQALIQAADAKPRWNFHKYLIGRDGQLIDSYASWTGPQSNTLRKAIEAAL